MATKKYVSLSKLSTFLDNLKTTFASLSHKHTVADITDYAVDDALSSTSTNPVQNQVLNEEFDSIVTAMNALESSIDSKVPLTRTVNGKALSSDITLDASDVNAYTKTEIDEAIANTASIQFITWEDGD